MKKRQYTTRIIIHHSASSKDTSVETITEWHKARGFSTIGYHFVVSGYNGSIHNGRDEKLVGAHTSGQNADSIGICVTGNYEVENLDGHAAAGLLYLINHIKDVYNLTWDSVSYHKSWGKTACPGKSLAAKIDEWKQKYK